MTLTFKPISGITTLEKQGHYRAYLSGCPRVASDYSFVNLWGWADVYGLEWAWEDDLVWIRQTRPDTRYWAPVGSWEDIDWGRVLAGHFPGGSQFIRVPEALMTIWEKHNAVDIEVEAARGHWDYVYNVSELTELKGNRFHKKKNLLNQFLKKYDHAYSAFEPVLVKEALALQNDWCEWRDCESSDTLAAENTVIEKVLNHWTRLDGLLGGTLAVDGRLVAYTVAEPLTADTVMIHFEKGSADVKGVYQAINQMFLKSLGGRFADVNREQDLDDPGLRKAKLSYHPSSYLTKYAVTLGMK